MAKKTSEQIYTDPGLRERLKQEIRAGDKGGRPGQWSARKAQMLVREYEKAGGGYLTSEEDKAESQRHLDHWEEEEWTTADGRPAVRGDETARYLPKEAWERLPSEEREATERKKREASRTGRQFVPNTGAAKEARRLAASLVDYDHLSVDEVVARLDGLSGEELEALRDHEASSKNRTTLLRRVDRELARRR